MSAESSPRAVVLLSGGLDSVTTLALAVARGREIFALSFAYGQRHRLELESAARQATRLGACRHEIVDVSHFGALVAPATSLLTASATPVPEAGTELGIPSTYVPARNTVFLAYALAWAEALDACEIWAGLNAVDYSGYPDCRPAFVEAFEHLANLATRVGVARRPLAEPPIRVHTPLLALGKHEIVALGTELGVDFADTVSCYDPAPGPLACGRCDSCRLRREGFVRAGVPDPTRYHG